MEDEKLADFITYYRDNTENTECYRDFWKLNREYGYEDNRLKKQHGMTLQSLDLKMDDVGKSKTLDTTGSRYANREDYKSKADAIARQYGFKGKSYDEHVKEQEAQKGQSQKGKPDAQQPTKEATSGSTKADEKNMTREERKQAFKQELQQITDRNKSQNKERDR